ncbi:ABC transporter permease [Occallatibacter savannae]|uniref:ABC transporter permease n=1 Tax=Occallatibacter savannae TaxID=1002691 RepID=UPI000D68E951|nr:ABC transporter permease [Occallatibacter savannae]
MQNLLYDLRYAIRQLRNTPGMALLAILTLALGVGANTAIFTVIDSVLLRSLPYAHSDRLVFIGPGGDKPSFGSTSWLNYKDLQTQAKLMESVAGYAEDVSVLQARDASVSVVAPRVTPNLFLMLGARPLLGRTFSDAEGQSSGPPVVLLSEGLWRDTFHADPNIVGQVVKIGGKPSTVVGVMPAGFHFPDNMGPDLQKGVWLPVQPTAEMLKERGYHFFNVVGVMRPEATVKQVQQEVSAIAARIPFEHEPVTFRVDAYQEVLTGPVRAVLIALFGALGLVLLIACANVSNLLIARALGRQQEFAVRAALGAGKSRLIGQMLAEGLLLSLLGCGVGVAVAELAMMGIRKLPDWTIPLAGLIRIHWTVLLVLAGIAAVTTILSSLLPALLVARANPQAALQAASRGVGSKSAGGKLSGWLVVGEVALSTLLLVGTGLLFRTLWNLEQSHLGFTTEHVTTFTAMPADAAGFSGMAVSEDTQNAPASVATITYEPVLERIRQLPGFEAAAMATSPPLSGMDLHSSFDILGQPTDRSHHPEARVSAVSGDYAHAMGTPIVRGRMIGDSDALTTPFVAVVNESLAKKYFADKDPIGKQINLGGKNTGMIKPYTIVGLLADQVDSNVGGSIQPLVLLPQQQIPTTSLFYQALLKTVVTFVVKTRGNIPVAQQVRTVFHELAPAFALDNFQTMQEAVDKNTFSQRLGLYLVGSFAGLAIAMVIAGLYGVLSQLVSYRRREIGVRMALGATRASVAKLVLRQGSLLIGGGLVAGLLLAFASGRLIKGFLYEVKPLDASTYAAVAVVLTLIGLVAALIPARRAATIQPIQALRDE